MHAWILSGWSRAGSGTQVQHHAGFSFLRFLLLLWRITTNVLAYNEINVWSYSSGRIEVWNGSHWAEIKMSKGLCSPRGSRGDPVSLPFPASGGCPQFQAHGPRHLQSQQLHCSDLCFHHHIAFPDPNSPASLLLLEGSQRARSDDPRIPPVSKAVYQQPRFQVKP